MHIAPLTTLINKGCDLWYLVKQWQTHERGCNARITNQMSTSLRLVLELKTRRQPGLCGACLRRRGAKVRRAQGCQGKATPFARSQDQDLWEAEEDSPIDERDEHEGAERSVLSVIVLDWSHPTSKGYISSLEWFHSPLNQATQMMSCMARVGSTPPSIQTLPKWSWNFSLSNNKKCSPCCHERAGLY
jgi:hypothetical protein